jgi:hypothetical protein
MALKETFDEMAWRKAAVYDPSTGCEVDRNGDGEIVLTMDGGHKSVTHTFADLVRGPCAGLRGAALEARIREFMEQSLASEAHYGTEEE